jgi:hypothetical protein
MSTETMPDLRPFYAAGRTDTRIANPLTRLASILIPAGTPIRSTNPRQMLRISQRDTRINSRTSPIMGSFGHVDVWGDRRQGRGFVVLPVLTYVGAGGYYQDVQVTPELCAANGIEAPVLPQFTDYEQAQLDTVPDFGPGYDDRLTVTG